MGVALKYKVVSSSPSLKYTGIETAKNILEVLLNELICEIKR